MRTLAIGLVILLWSGAASATTRICVGVQQKSWYRASPPAAPRAPATTKDGPPGAAPATKEGEPAGAPVKPPAPPGPPVAVEPPTWAAPAAPRANPHEIDPTRYLRRLLEYQITHEPGFAAVDDGCPQRLAVDLYQLESGWTVFARYSGTEREEKVDHADVDEFGELAERVVTALLRNRTISQAITRENVLRADSETNLRTIEGTGHLVFGMGTEARVGRLPTAQGQGLAAAEELRVLTPLTVQLGYRRKLHAWGLDAFARLGLGTGDTGIHENDLGGHVDYAASLLLGLHFLHYADAPGVNSLYFGGGASLEVAFFNSIRPLKLRTAGERELLTGGGLNIDGVIGYEFMRASSVHFFGQLEIDAPTYIIQTENTSGAIDTYLPGAVAQIGVIF
jgi:hypothetical protein